MKNKTDQSISMITKAAIIALGIFAGIQFTTAVMKKAKELSHNQKIQSK